jgi:oxygen-independent coproporphyrinogen-3 oxidase
LGASAIGRLPQGYVQNEAAIAKYERMIQAEGCAVTRGLALSEEDRVRALVIERLMCDLTFSACELSGAPSAIVSAVIAQAQDALANDQDGFLTPTLDGFTVTPEGRPFVRNIAAQFDSYLTTARGRHSQTV